MLDTILIVEDEPKLSSLLEDYLQQSGFNTHIIADGTEVTEWVRENCPSLVLLDLMLPGLGGLEIFKQIRGFSILPIIMVTAKVDDLDRLLGLELGADDYICKPFIPQELVSRVKNVLRRTKLSKESDTEKTGGLILDKNSYQVKFEDREQSLTRVEFELLLAFIESPGRVFTRDQLMDKIYNDHRVVSTRTVDSHIKKLRQKLCILGESENSQEWIVSIYGLGYKLEY